MDLLQSVKKEGSRGGVSFSWSDVKDSKHRENYLGHSVMAPVGRWQKGKDLSWYAKADDAELTPEERLEKEREMRREELRKVKEAEEDAMAKALGLPVPDRTNANNEPLGMSREKQEEVNRALKETLDDPEPARTSRKDERRRERRDRDDRGSRRHRRSRSRSRSRNRDERQLSRHTERRERSRSRDRDRDRKPDADRSRHDRRYSDRTRSRERDHRSHRRKSRSRSPGHSGRSRYERR